MSGMAIFYHHFFIHSLYLPILLFTVSDALLFVFDNRQT